MRKNTKKMLLLLYFFSGTPQGDFGVPYDFLYNTFSDLTPGGIRSVVQILLCKKYVIKKILNGQSFFSISDAGKLKLQLLYPGIREKRKNNANDICTVLLIVQSPETRKSGDVLRRLLAQHSFTFITRGAYFYPFEELPESLFKVLVNDFSSSVMLMKVKEFSLAIPDLNDKHIFLKMKERKSLSGISRDLDKLIDFLNSPKYSTVRAKRSFYSICKKMIELFDRQPSLISQEQDSQNHLFQIREGILASFQVLFFSQK